MTNDTAILDTVLAASSLFDLEGTSEMTGKGAFRKYSRKVHPDMFQDEDTKRKADKAFAHLNNLFDKSEGKSVPTSGGPSSTQRRAEKNKIKTKRHEYLLRRVFNRNETFTKYIAEYDGGNEEAYISILNDPRDADLADAHVDALEKLDDVKPEYRLFFPIKMENLRYKDATTNEERTIVVTRSISGFDTMATILDYYPNGINGRDMAWMFRRMLVAAGNAHDIGLVNGAPTLDAFMINDAEHGIILSDWQYSVPTGTKLTAIPAAYEDVYPEYALKGEPVDYKLDIHIIATMAERLLERNAPRPLFAFFSGCKLANTPPAAQLLAEFDALLDRLYGKRKFNVFSLRKRKDV